MIVPFFVMLLTCKTVEPAMFFKQA